MEWWRSVAFQNVSYLVTAPVVNLSVWKSANVAAPTTIVAPFWEASGARVSISSYVSFFYMLMFWYPFDQKWTYYWCFSFINVSLFKQNRDTHRLHVFSMNSLLDIQPILSFEVKSSLGFIFQQWMRMIRCARFRSGPITCEQLLYNHMHV